MTLARTARDAELLGAALDRLAAVGLPVVVADGGSLPGFAARLRERFTVVPPEGPALIGQIKAALRAARERSAGWILYTEPDKEWFFGHQLPALAARASDDPSDGVVIAARSDRGFATFPAVQRLTESALNRLCAEFTGVALDYSYGPFLVRAELSALVDDLDPEIGWGWRPFVFASAARSGKRITALVGDFECPPEQRDEDEEEKRHRIRQLRQNLDGLLAAVR